MTAALRWLFLVFAFVPAAASAATVADLQHLLDNAGYNTGGETGKWSDGTATALSAFAAHYSVETGSTAAAPDDAALTSIIAAAKAKLDAAYAAYPTQRLPERYFVGLGSQWYFNIHNWGSGGGALVNRDGKAVRVKVDRYFAPLDDDAAKFHSAGVTVIRAMLGVEGALFFDECNYKSDPSDLAIADACYTRAFAKAKAEKWARQTELLSHFGDNPVVKLYVDSVEYWNKNGFHAMIAPNDFFTGAGSHFNGTDANTGTDPIFHAALANDAGFQKFYPRFVAAIVDEIRKRNLTNVSVQTANEPRFCSRGGQPAPGGLKKWQAIERAVFDEVRMVAPRISLVSAAICTSGDQYFSQGRPYSELGQVMPIHSDLDDVTYSIHLYNPRTLMLAGAQNALYKPGTLIHYPYQPIAASAGTNKESQVGIGIYNRVKPGPQFFEKMFADLEVFAKANAIRIMVDEINAPKPNFGLPREDRVALVRDIVASSKRHDVPIIHFGTLNEWGLSSCTHSIAVPDHRFDPALLNQIAVGNAVPGSNPSAAPEPIEVQCGREVKIRTIEHDNNTSANSSTIDSVFKSTTKGVASFDYNIRGTYSRDTHNFLQVDFTLIDSDVGANVPAGLGACSGVEFPNFNGANHLKFGMAVINKTMQPQGVDCILKNVSPALAAQVQLLGVNFRDVAADMVASGQADTIGNDNLRQWINDIASGAVTIGPAQN